MSSSNSTASVNADAPITEDIRPRVEALIIEVCLDASANIQKLRAEGRNEGLVTDVAAYGIKLKIKTLFNNACQKEKEAQKARTEANPSPSREYVDELKAISLAKDFFRAIFKDAYLDELEEASDVFLNGTGEEQLRNKFVVEKIYDHLKEWNYLGPVEAIAKDSSLCSSVMAIAELTNTPPEQQHEVVLRIDQKSMEQLKLKSQRVGMKPDLVAAAMLSNACLHGE